MMTNQVELVTAAVQSTTLNSSTITEKTSTLASTNASSTADPMPQLLTPEKAKKVLHLVIDSGAIIKGTNLAGLAENFWTVPDVLNEIRDKKSRGILERLPFSLHTREPSAEAMKAVVDFSRKTGDFSYLSLTDLRVMALSYQLEVESNNSDHLRSSPSLSQTVTRAANGKIIGGSQPTIPCKYYGTSMGCKYGNECRFTHVDTENANVENGAEIPKKKIAIPCRFLNTPEGCKYGNDCSFFHDILEATEGTTSEASKVTDDEGTDAGAIPVINENIRNADVKSRIMGGLGASSNAGAADDDGKNWITEDNMNKFTTSPFGDCHNFEEIATRLPVACITTDYSMQNVMLQIGLRLLSLEGMLIKRVKQWILRCVACFTTSTEMDRLFCPKCGNSTLERVSYSLDRDGHMTFYTRASRPTKLLGTKFSLPKPKGGRHGDLLLREDQLLVGIWGQRQRQHKKVMQSAFGENVAHDLGVKAEKQTTIRVGYGRMNPNAQKGRERRGKKKRNKTSICMKLLTSG